jgi:hypothetical protein
MFMAGKLADKPVVKVAKAVGGVALTVALVPLYIAGWLLNELFVEKPYQAKDGRTYNHKESPCEYAQRHQELEKKERARKDAIEARKRQREEEIRTAEENLVRARQGYKPGEGHIASNGIVYPKKETPEEYHARTLKNINDMAQRAREEYERGKGQKRG